MAQGHIKALRNAACGTVHGVVARQPNAVADANSPLVPTAVAAALHLPASRFDGQHLAGSGALVWEGEVIETPRRVH